MTGKVARSLFVRAFPGYGKRNLSERTAPFITVGSGPATEVAPTAGGPTQGYTGEPSHESDNTEERDAKANAHSSTSTKEAHERSPTKQVKPSSSAEVQTRPTEVASTSPSADGSTPLIAAKSNVITSWNVGIVHPLDRAFALAFKVKGVLNWVTHYRGPLSKRSEDQIPASGSLLDGPERRRVFIYNYFRPEMKLEGVASDMDIHTACLSYLAQGNHEDAFDTYFPPGTSRKAFEAECRESPREELLVFAASLEVCRTVSAFLERAFPPEQVTLLVPPPCTLRFTAKHPTYPAEVVAKLVDKFNQAYADKYSRPFAFANASEKAKLVMAYDELLGRSDERFSTALGEYFASQAQSVLGSRHHPNMFPSSVKFANQAKFGRRKNWRGTR